MFPVLATTLAETAATYTNAALSLNVPQNNKKQKISPRQLRSVASELMPSWHFEPATAKHN